MRRILASLLVFTASVMIVIAAQLDKDIAAKYYEVVFNIVKKYANQLD
jgi:hypothetical protein